jgi:type IV secretion system protein VirB8
VSRDRELQAYFDEAASWDADRAAQSRRSARVAWIVAGAGWCCTGLVAAALMLLMPLKQVEPFVIRVNDTSGVIDVVPAYDGSASLPEAVTRYFLTHYVTICERFNYETAESDYEECGAFHTAQRNQAWFAQWTLSNPDSPFNVHKDGSSVKSEVSAVSFFTRASGVADLAHVRYVKARRAPGSAEEKRTHWIATVQYAYGEPSTDPKIRRWNPLGFKILEFRIEPEVVSDERTTPELAIKSQATRGMP